MLKYNMLTSHKQGNRIANRAQLSELRTENMYQRRLKRVWKMVCFSPNWSQDLHNRAACTTKNFKEHPSRRLPRARNVAVQRGLSMSQACSSLIYMKELAITHLILRVSFSVPYAICWSHLPANISVSRRLNGLKS